MGIVYDIDPTIVRGLDYYTHTVFEIVSINKEMGSQATLLAGGRYDGLIQYFGGPEMSGMGWALGMERILIALEAEKINIVEEESIDAYVLCLDESAQLEAFKVVTMLRSHGFVSETDYLQRKFKAQFKSVERMKAKVAILIGAKEVENKQVTIKKIDTQEQFVVPSDEIIQKMDEILEERF